MQTTTESFLNVEDIALEAEFKQQFESTIFNSKPITKHLAARKKLLKQLINHRQKSVEFIFNQFREEREFVDYCLEKVKEIIIILGSPRGGTSAFKDLLAQAQNTISLSGEHRHLFTLTGLNFPDNQHSEASKNLELSADNKHFILSNIYYECQGEESHELSKRDLEKYAWDWSWRLPMQWPELSFKPEAIVQAVMDVSQQYRVKSRKDGEGFRVRLLKAFQQLHPQINPWYYDLPVKVLAKEFPQESLPKFPPSQIIIEVSPYTEIKEMIMRKHLVFIETNRSGLMGLLTAKQRGFKVTLIKADSNSYSYKGHDYKTIFQQIDRIITVENTLSETVLIETLQKIMEEEPIDAVITVLQNCTLPLAKAAFKLNLAYNSPEAVEATRNKFLSRQILENSNIPSAMYARASSVDEAINAANQIGFPLMVKPSCGSASLFASVVQNMTELPIAFRNYESGLLRIEPKFQSVLKSDLLLEEYLCGRMLSVEAGISGGEFVVFTTGERKRCSYDETIEIGTTIPAPISNSQWADVVEYAERVTRTFGLNQGLFHIEIMLTESGPRLIEFNPRMMGGSLPLAYNYAYEDNIYDYLIDAHLGQPFKPLHPTPKTFVTSRIFGSVEKKTTRSDFDLSWTTDYQQYELQLELYIKPGKTVEVVNSNFEYVGTFRLRAHCAEESNYLADEVIEKLSQTLGLTLTI